MDREKEDLASAAAGQRARQFLNSEFWKLDFEPMLVKLQEDSKMAAMWKPGDAADRGLAAAYFSGQHKAVEYICLQVTRLVRDGQEAEALLARSKEKNKKAEAHV